VRDGIRQFERDHFEQPVGATMADDTEAFIPVEGMLEAPIIYFEVCPTFDNNGGLINIMLAAGLIEPSSLQSEGCSPSANDG
jgi:hypothetical protein